MANTVVAIHQPNFFPWLGFFDKLHRCDVFVVLDHVQYPKTGGVWTNRVKLSLGGEARWFTAPIERAYHGVRTIADMPWQLQAPWRKKLVKSLRANYARAAHFQETMAWLEPLVMHPEPLVARYNSAAILSIAQRLGIDTGKMVWSSTLDLQSQSTDLLIEITRAVRGDIYRSGGGAGGYQEDDAFANAGLGLSPQAFAHPQYPQGKAPTFLAGLSVIDALMHVGVDGVQALLRTVSAQTPDESPVLR